MKQLGEFNRAGRVEAEDAIPVENQNLETPVAETDSDETAPAGEEAESVDADGDGHDDETGEFVEGNQEAAD